AVAIDREIVDRNDGGVLEPALDARLAQEPRQVLCRRLGAADPLDRDLAADVLVVGEQHLAHAALAQHLAEATARTYAGRERPRVAAAPGKRAVAARGVEVPGLRRRGQRSCRWWVGVALPQRHRRNTALDGAGAFISIIDHRRD